MESQLCMKCGRDLKPGVVFCDRCLEEMEKYPVKPGVVVLLPKRSAQPQKPAPRRRHSALPPEEQVTRLKKRVVGLTLALILAVTAAVALGWLHFSGMMLKDEEGFAPGQNYSSMVEDELEDAK